MCQKNKDKFFRNNIMYNGEKGANLAKNAKF